ncbi:MAG: hypothetical protein ACLVIY_14645 [Anaerobutyricum soehngenii]
MGEQVDIRLTSAIVEVFYHGGRVASHVRRTTFEKLKALNCSAMADEFQNQINDSKSYNLLGFEERLGLLVDGEWNRRQANKLKSYQESCFLCLVSMY